MHFLLPWILVAVVICFIILGVGGLLYVNGGVKMTALHPPLATQTSGPTFLPWAPPNDACRASDQFLSFCVRTTGALSINAVGLVDAWLDAYRNNDKAPLLLNGATTKYDDQTWTLPQTRFKRQQEIQQLQSAPANKFLELFNGVYARQLGVVDAAACQDLCQASPFCTAYEYSGRDGCLLSAYPPRAVLSGWAEDVYARDSPFAQTTDADHSVVFLLRNVQALTGWHNSACDCNTQCALNKQTAIGTIDFQGGFSSSGSLTGSWPENLGDRATAFQQAQRLSATPRVADNGGPWPHPNTDKNAAFFANPDQKVCLCMDNERAKQYKGETYDPMLTWFTCPVRFPDPDLFYHDVAKRYGLIT